jgi:hypothetical protein
MRTVIIRPHFHPYLLECLKKNCVFDIKIYSIIEKKKKERKVFNSLFEHATFE